MKPRTLAPLFVILFSVSAQAQEVFGDEKAAYQLGPARVVSDSFVTYASFNEDGKRLIYARINPSQALEPEKAVAEWFVYDRPSKRTFPIRLKDISEATEIQVLGDGKHLRLSDRTIPGLNGFYNLESGRFQAFAIAQESIVSNGLATKTPFLLIQANQDSVGVVFPFQAPWFFSPSKSWKIFAPINFDSQAVRILCQSEGSPTRWRTCTVARATGAVSYAEVKDGEFVGLFREDDSTQFEFAYHESGYRVGIEPVYDGVKRKPFTKLDKWAVVCKPKTDIVLFEWESDVVAYCEAGVLLIREITAIDHKLAIEFTAQRRHKESLRAAKQVGIALLLWAADADDLLPTGENFAAKLLPYAKNADILANFTYTFAGGPLDKIKDPANTELGFVLGEGGRAVVYADGHAKWVSDKP